MSNLSNERKEYKVGMICAIVAMIVWGLAPMYWRALLPIDSFVIIAYRIIFAGIVCGVASLCVYGKAEMKKSLGDKKNAGLLFFAGFLITINWSVYIYGVNSGQTIGATIGYYITPLLVSIAGIFLFKERLTKYKFIAITLAFIGVFSMIIYFGRLPAITLTLAISFAMYAVIKKHLKMKAIISLFYETIIFAVLAIGYLVYMEATGQGALHIAEPYQIVMLAFSGFLTAVPLAMFSMAANRLTLVSVGVMQYLGPSIGIAVGFFVFREPFFLGQLIACILIWIGLMFFTYGEIKLTRELRRSN